MKKNKKNHFSFKQSIIWHTLEALGYHAGLLIHHMLFFSIAPKELYGAIGTIFSCIYLSSNFLHLGIIDTIATFFADFSQSQQATKTFIVEQLFYNIVAFCIYVIGIILFNTILFPHFFPFYTVFLIIFIVFFETTKKIIKRFLRVAGMVPIIAGTSIVSIFCFICMIWIPFFYISSGLYITVVLQVFACMSCLECLVDGYFLFQWYKKLPQKQTLLLYTNRIFHHRWNMFLIDVGKFFISGNLFVPFFAITKGFYAVATLKFITSIAHNILAMFDKIINRTSVVFLSQQKHVVGGKKNESVFKLSNAYNGFLCILLFLFMWYRWSYSFTAMIGSFILYYVLQLLHKTHILYSNLLIIQEKPLVVLLMTILQVIFTISIMKISQNQSVVLSCLILVSLFQYIVFFISTKHYFKTKPPKYAFFLTTLLVLFLLQSYWV